jgi:hypothetical protein
MSWSAFPYLVAYLRSSHRWSIPLVRMVGASSRSVAPGRARCRWKGYIYSRYGNCIQPPSKTSKRTRGGWLVACAACAARRRARGPDNGPYPCEPPTIHNRFTEIMGGIDSSRSSSSTSVFVSSYVRCRWRNSSQSSPRRGRSLSGESDMASGALTACPTPASADSNRGTDRAYSTCT